MEELNKYEYTLIKQCIIDYGLNVAFLVLYDFEKSERYYDCNLLNESIKRFCNSINLEYNKLTEEDILKDYKSDFWQFNLSGEVAFNNLPIYKQRFKSIFTTLKGQRIHRDMYAKINK